MCSVLYELEGFELRAFLLLGKHFTSHILGASEHRWLAVGLHLDPAQVQRFLGPAKVPKKERKIKSYLSFQGYLISVVDDVQWVEVVKRMKSPHDLAYSCNVITSWITQPSPL